MVSSISANPCFAQRYVQPKRKVDMRPVNKIEQNHTVQNKKNNTAMKIFAGLTLIELAALALMFISRGRRNAAEQAQTARTVEAVQSLLSGIKKV